MVDVKSIWFIPFIKFKTYPLHPNLTYKIEPDFLSETPIFAVQKIKLALILQSRIKGITQQRKPLIVCN